MWDIKIDRQIVIQSIQFIIIWPSAACIQQHRIIQNSLSENE